jgi:hypothetical protein
MYKFQPFAHKTLDKQHSGAGTLLQSPLVNVLWCVIILLGWLRTIGAYLEVSDNKRLVLGLIFQLGGVLSCAGCGADHRESLGS